MKENRVIGACPLISSQVANYFGIGNSKTESAEGSWILNVIKCKLGRYRVRIVQHRDVINKKVEHEGFIHTTQIEIDGVSKFSEGETVTQDICRLLSFVSMSQVVAFEYSFGGQKQRRFMIRGASMYFRPVLEINNGNQVASYLQLVWPMYRKMKRTRRLAEVIDMLTIAELPNQPLEVKLAQVFILFENLKSTYARSKGIPFIAGFFRELSIPSKANLKRGKPLKFEELLTMMLKDVGMKCSLKRLISLRNEIIHFGLSRKPFESMRNNYDNCQDIIREYLLRLLRYKGRYLIYSQACSAIKEL